MKIYDITEGKFADISDPKDFSPENVEVNIRGYGVLTLEQLKNRIKGQLANLSATVDSKPEVVRNEILKGALPYMVNAYVEALQELNTPQMKRKATLAKRSMNTESVKAVLEHVKQGVPLCDSVFRYQSDAYFESFQIAKALYAQGLLESLDWESQELLETDIGEFVNIKGIGRVPLDVPFMEETELDEAKYQGKKVELNKPKRGGSKKFYVYVRNPKTKKIKKVSFGAAGGGGNLAVKLKDPKARKAFADRHNCDQKKDKTKAGYWSCRLPRYSKSLGLSGSGQWW